MGDAEYTRPAGHIGVGAQQGRRRRPLHHAAEAQNLYGDWTCDYTLDVVGGWYDAGDHGKYVVNGGIAVAQLLSTYERTLYAPTARHRRPRRRQPGHPRAAATAFPTRWTRHAGSSTG